MTELLTVIAIIGILAALTIGGAYYARTKAKVSRAQAEIAAMETALESYKNDRGIYPDSSNNRNNAGTNSSYLVRALSGTQYSPCSGITKSKSYFAFKREHLGQLDVHTDFCTNIFLCPPAFTNMCTNVFTTVSTNYFIVDPFGQPYNYFHNASGVQSNAVTFDLWSYGPDGRDDTDDEITNWRR